MSQSPDPAPATINPHLNINLRQPPEAQPASGGFMSGRCPKNTRPRVSDNDRIWLKHRPPASSPRLGKTDLRHRAGTGFDGKARPTLAVPRPPEPRRRAACPAPHRVLQATGPWFQSQVI